MGSWLSCCEETRSSVLDVVDKGVKRFERKVKITQFRTLPSVSIVQWFLKPLLPFHWTNLRLQKQCEYETQLEFRFSGDKTCNLYNFKCKMSLQLPVFVQNRKTIALQTTPFKPLFLQGRPSKQPHLNLSFSRETFQHLILQNWTTRLSVKLQHQNLCSYTNGIFSNLILQQAFFSLGLEKKKIQQV